MISWRIKRQLIVVGILLVITGGIVFWFGRGLITAPTCTDGRKNQGEVATDCGGPCASCELRNPKALTIFWARVAPAGANLYDAVALVENKNEFLASAEIEYEFNLYDKFGAVARKTGISFVYPQERLYIIEPALRTSRDPVRIDFKVTRIEWQATNATSPLLTVESREHMVTEENARKQSVVQAGVLNSSGLDLAAIETGIVVFDPQGNLLGANRVAGGGIRAGERATIKSIWPAVLPGIVGTIEVYPRANVFEPHTILIPE